MSRERQSDTALQVTGLRVGVGGLELLRGVDFALASGERLGLVGESGSGKSVTALSIMGLLTAPARVTAGSVLLGGTELVGARRRDLDRIRGRRVAMIYQDPGAALDPIMSIGSQLVEAIALHEPRSRAGRRTGRSSLRARAVELLAEVGIEEPDQRVRDYPHQLSGGMRQRVMIAMALACDPEVLICDEPTTALDVTTQARVMALVDRLCRERGTAALLITHDLGVAAGFCDRIAVMYAGQLVELAPTEAIFDDPRHPYTQALLGSTLELGTPYGPLPAIPGSPRAPQDVDTGCAFRDRCPIAAPECAHGPIELRVVSEVDERSSAVPYGESLARCVKVTARTEVAV